MVTNKKLYRVLKKVVSNIYQVKMNLMLLLVHNSRINHSMIVKKAMMLDFYEIRLTHNQNISNTVFLVVKRLWVCRIMLVTVLSIKQNLWQRLNVSMDITVGQQMNSGGSRMIDVQHGSGCWNGFSPDGR